jgi:hypothetical protein
MVTAQCVKDSFQYSFNLSEETLDIQGVSVEIWHDKDVSNPYLDYDGMAPALWLHPQRYGGRIDDFGGYDLERFFGSVSPAWVSRHWRAIAAILDLTESDVDSDCHDMLANHGGGMSETRREYFSERLYEMKATTWGAGTDYLEALASLYRLAGVAADTFEVTGYCQGDVALGLIVHLPEWRERVGCPAHDAKALKRDMQGDADCYAAWVWGNCYGFTVDDDDSCGGFYGFDVDYVASEIADAVNRVLEARAAQDACAMQAARPDLAPAYT